jgi:hypothetical protein
VMPSTSWIGCRVVRNAEGLTTQLEMAMRLNAP